MPGQSRKYLKMTNTKYSTPKYPNFRRYLNTVPFSKYQWRYRLHWLPVQQRITYKLAVLTYKVRSTSTPVYLHRRIAERACSRTLRSATIPLLDKPFMRTDFSKRAFSGLQHRLSGTRCHKQFSSVIL